MIVSWNWLKQYVPLDMPREELELRLMMAGLNHEGTEQVGDDLAIDLEVTSNRPDCLSHLGVAREISVLWDTPLTLPAAQPAAGPLPAEKLVRVRIDCPDLCLRYIARVIRGVSIGPSPRWLVRRLEAIGLAPINNVVDISNYVLMECGQPLHTFDFGKLEGGEIIVRRPRPGETIEAIDHKTYRLEREMCLICDARRPVAIGGVMGGAQTEISRATGDVLVESAEFDPVSIRNTARSLNLHSDSSFRFERRVDPEGLDWASRRCCELILEEAGGQLAAGAVDVGRPPPERKPIVLRFSQLKRILGIDVPPERVRAILLALGNVEEGSGVRGQGRTDCQSVLQGSGVRGQGRTDCQSVLHGSGGTGQRSVVSGQSPVVDRAASGPEPDVHPSSPILHPSPPVPSPLSPLPSITVRPPSWRRDLSREIDLVEEVGRIYGYERIAEDVSVPMAPSARPREDRVLDKVREVLIAAGFDEAVTLSVVAESASAAFSPWTDAEPLRSVLPVIRGADRLRRSIVPSLLAVRRANESQGNAEIELFEIARAYLPEGGGLPREELLLSMASGRGYPVLKGLIEAICARLRITLPLEADEAAIAIFDPACGCRLRLDNEVFGYVGQLAAGVLGTFDLRGPAAVAEIRLRPLIDHAELIPRYVPQSPYPAVSRDLNLVVDEAVRWADIRATVRRHAGAGLESLEYRDTYRDAERLGAAEKSLLFTVAWRSADGTLTSEQADELRDQIVAACRQEHAAELRG